MSDRGDRPEVSEDVEDDAVSRITNDLVCQIEAHLPLRSLKSLMTAVDEIVVEGHRLSLALFERHIGDAAFPVETVEDLADKVGEGVRHAVSLARQPGFPVRDQALTEILATSILGKPEIDGRPTLRIPVPPAYYLYNPRPAGVEGTK